MATPSERFVTDAKLTTALTPINYSSGIYKVTTLENGWTGTIVISRTGNLVEISIENLIGSAATAGTVYTLPVGLRPRRIKRCEVTTSFTTDAVRDPMRLNISSTGVMSGFSYANTTFGHYGEIVPYTTTEAVPATMPGTL